MFNMVLEYRKKQTNKQIPLSLSYLPWMRREGWFISYVGAVVLIKHREPAHSRDTKLCRKLGKLTRVNYLHAEFMEAEPYALKNTKKLSVAEA